VAFVDSILQSKSLALLKLRCI